MAARITNRGGRPRKRNRNARHDVLKRARYAVMIGLGLDSYSARSAAGRNSLFVETLIAHGKHPEDYGELAMRLTGGHQRNNPGRQARYRELRRRGLSAADASRLSDKVGRFEITVRQLDRGIPLSG